MKKEDENKSQLKVDPNFCTLCIYERHTRLIKEVYSRFPRKIKEKIEKNWIYVTDIFDESKKPFEKVHMENMAFYIDGGNAIYLIPKHGVFSDECFKGLIAHETAHACIYFTPQIQRIILRWIYKIKFNLSGSYIHWLYKSSNKPYEELHADTLAKKWGFGKEIDQMNKERITIINVPKSDEIKI